MAVSNFRTKPVFSESGRLKLSKYIIFTPKFGGTIKWGAFLGDLARSFAPEVVLETRILISKQTALFIPILKIVF